MCYLQEYLKKQGNLSFSMQSPGNQKAFPEKAKADRALQLC